MDVQLAAERLERQGLGSRRFERPEQVVAWFGAMQAQEYLSSLWAVGVRLAAATEGDVERAIDDGRIVRTHGFRATWQLVAREDVRWMLALVGARLRPLVERRIAELGMETKTVVRCGTLFARALEGGKHLTRAEMGAVLARGKIDAGGPRLMHILGHAELAGVLCNGKRRGKQATHALLDERVPPRPAATREQDLAELARRYAQSRGPATVEDFSWWTGLPLGQAREAVALAGIELDQAPGRKPRASRSPTAHLLPGFDEYLVGYRTRDAQLDPARTGDINAGGGLLRPSIVINTQIVGTWRRTLPASARAPEVTIDLQPFSRLGPTAEVALTGASARYAAFLGRRSRKIFRNGAGA